MFDRPCEIRFSQMLRFTGFDPNTHSHYENHSFGRVPPFVTQWVLIPPPPPPLSSQACLRKTAKFSTPRFATISLVPDSESHKPKRNDITTTMVLHNNKNNPLSDGPVSPQIAGAYLPMGKCASPQGHMLIDRSWGKTTLPKLGYQVPKREIFIMTHMRHMH